MEKADADIDLFAIALVKGFARIFVQCEHGLWTKSITKNFFYISL